MTCVRALLLVAAAWLLATGASAHEVRPAYLQLHQIDAETYDVVWKVPGRGEMRLGLDVDLPPGSVDVTPPRGVFAGEAYTERWRFTRAGGLAGATIGIDGLAATVTDVLVRIERLDGTTQVTRLSAAQPTFVVEAEPGRLEVAKTYLALGIGHILGGIDHLLFVLALLFLVRGWRRVLATVTAFTVAHSLTLAAATLGWVHVPQKPVEAVIALSIVFVAAEILRLRRYQNTRTPLGRLSPIGSATDADTSIPSVSVRWPWIVAFTFGLLHGFGFAGALAEVGLPQNAIPVALLFFNVGVEIGQLLFIGAVFALVASTRWIVRSGRLPALDRTPVQVLRLVPPYAIGAIAMFWVIQRIAAF
jgi:hydrogenase/urease accessory protein HupE